MGEIVVVGVARRDLCSDWRIISMNHRLPRFVGLGIVWAAVALAYGQKVSVQPGINDSFRNPDIDEFKKKFEVESRELFARRTAIVAACQIKPGEAVADIGAGTGLFTRLFAAAVGDKGRVIAVDIAPKFLDHIASTAREAGLRNVDPVLATQDSTQLPADSVDVAFICDTYHHFETPAKTLASIHRAMKPGGRLILIDFRRIPGKSSDWVMHHVRAGQEVFEAEIEEAGFEKVLEDTKLLHENYFVVFKKVSKSSQS
ncbi:MAG: methyltransferase domain-containing protein [Pirellulales bacterium]|nr:methyltransferase domain-containing protein [Pirellulales bacterium]